MTYVNVERDWLTISKSLARVVATPSYGETQLPEVALQALSVTTLVPSRLSTVSRVSQVPETSNVFSYDVPLEVMENLLISHVLNSLRA